MFRLVPLAASSTTLESQVSPARMGMPRLWVSALAMICAAASRDTGEKNTSQPCCWALVM